MGFLKPHYQEPPAVTTPPPPAPTLNSPYNNSPVGVNSPIGQNNGVASTVKTSPNGAAPLPASQLSKPELNSPVGRGSGDGDTNTMPTDTPAMLPGMTIITPHPNDLTAPAEITVRSLLGG